VFVLTYKQTLTFSTNISLYGMRDVVSLISFHSQEMIGINLITKEALERSVPLTYSNMLYGI